MLPTLVLNVVRAQRPIGTQTRGTTNPNRLRRVDRWLIDRYAAPLRSEPAPVVVDLGYGAHPVTTFELAGRLREVNPGVRVVGLEIDPVRVAVARPLARDGVLFARGGFEVSLPAELAEPSGPRARPLVIRAANVLRQYAEADVGPAWTVMTGALAPGGVLLDVTSDELGRRCCWVEVRAEGPVSLSFGAALNRLDRPGELAERLPKALIHRNVPGEGIHTFLSAWDAAWRRQAPAGTYGRRQRFIAAARSLRDQGWPVTGGTRRWRIGELTVAWSVVAPSASPPATPATRASTSRMTCLVTPP